MKKILLLLLLCLVINQVKAQIGFEDNSIFNDFDKASYAQSVYATDIDGDGDLDVLSASYADNKIAWYENLNGQGNFSPPKTISINVPRAVAVYSSDIDNDGDMDVLSVSELNGNISWYENINGLGEFSTEKVIANIPNASTVYTSDLDGDGDMDVVLASLWAISWYENIDGMGNFSSTEHVVNNMSGTRSLQTHDFDLDGDQDILTETNGQLMWIENIDGQGNFGINQGVVLDEFIYQASVNGSDIDGDGDIDILVTSRNNSHPTIDKFSWYENLDGQGNFGSQQLIEDNVQGAISIYSADFDNDGDLDVVAASFLDHKISWYENTNGQGNFGNQQVITTDAKRVWSVYAADINGDGNTDILSASADDSTIAWYENLDNQGNFSYSQIIVSEVLQINSIDSGDLDGDGDIDLVAASWLDNKISWYKNNNGLGDFDNPKIITLNVNDPEHVFINDINGDGNLDIVSVSNRDHKIAWYENTDGQGNFGAEQIIDVGDQPPLTYTNSLLSAYMVDIDNDGDLDVLASSTVSSEVYWYENLDGLGNYSSKHIIASGVNNVNWIYADDVDTDGFIDVLMAINGGGAPSSKKVVWYKNTNGQGNFGTEQMIGQGISTYEFHTSDFDNDGDIDVFFTSYNGEIYWYENNDGLGNFNQEQLISEQYDNHGSVSSFDVDSDGDMDIISGYKFVNTNNIVWYENLDGQGNFGVKQIISDDTDGFNVIHISDIDGDGDNDIVSGSNSNHNFKRLNWHKNVGIATNEINGTIQFDINSDGCDENDIFALNILIETSNNASETLSTFSLANGVYQLFPEEGTYTTSILNLPNYYTSAPISHTSSFTELGNTDTADFCIIPSGVFNDLNIAVYPSLSEPRPGFNTTYRIVYKNVGTTQLSGNVTFEYDNTKLQFLNASQTVSSQSTNILTFDYTDLSPFETRTIDLVFNVFPPPTTNIDDILTAMVTINPVSGDTTPEDNVFELEQTVIGSYDPNDISVLEGDKITIDEIDKYLHYIIRFQNTGTASAINVKVDHVLDEKLDWTTMQLESLSHQGRVEITNGNNVSFIFDNINLPDSTNDEPNSHGFITFKIKPKADVVVGNIISGVADIFFDFNPPITTNTVNTEIIAPLSVGEFQENNISIYPNPTKDIITINTNREIEKLTIYDINGRQLKAVEIKNSLRQYQLNINNLSKGIYFVKIQTDLGIQTQKIIKE